MTDFLLGIKKPPSTTVIRVEDGGELQEVTGYA